MIIIIKYLLIDTITIAWPLIPITLTPPQLSQILIRRLTKPKLPWSWQKKIWEKFSQINRDQKSRVPSAGILYLEGTATMVRNANLPMDLKSWDAMRTLIRHTKPSRVSASWRKDTVLMGIAAISYIRKRKRWKDALFQLLYQIFHKLSRSWVGLKVDWLTKFTLIDINDIYLLLYACLLDSELMQWIFPKLLGIFEYW
jgi:hypothetical protein